MPNPTRNTKDHSQVYNSSILFCPGLVNKAHRNRLWGQHLTEAVATSRHSPHLSAPICLQPITRYVSYWLCDKSLQHTEVALHTLPGCKTVLGMLFPNGSLSAINVLVLMSKLWRWRRECRHWHNVSKRWFPLQLHYMRINILERCLLHLSRPFAVTLINRSNHIHIFKHSWSISLLPRYDATYMRYGVERKETTSSSRR